MYIHTPSYLSGVRRYENRCLWTVRNGTVYVLKAVVLPDKSFQRIPCREVAKSRGAEKSDETIVQKSGPI